MNRISNSIIRNYVTTLAGNPSFNTKIDYANVIRANSAREVREEALLKARNVTYVDRSPYDTLVKVPYFLVGQIYEALLFDNLDMNRLVTFKDRRTKVAKADVQAKCEAIGDNALPVSEKILEGIKGTVARARDMFVSREMFELTGLSTVGDLIDSEKTDFNVKLQSSLDVGGAEPLDLTGECDGLHITSDGITVILEIKTSSKLYYPNNARKVIEGSQYHFQVAFYNMLLTLIGHSVYKDTLFQLANPSRGVVSCLDYTTLTPETTEMLQVILRSL
jgi:hypothetical protein